MFLLSNISRGLQDNIPYRGRCLSAILDLMTSVSKLPQDMHRIMVSGLPAGCRLTAIFDVSSLKASRLNANFSDRHAILARHSVRIRIHVS